MMKMKMEKLREKSRKKLKKLRENLRIKTLEEKLLRLKL